MSRHSKSVNAKPYFSHAERKKLTEYGTQNQRVSKDSLIEVGICGLCLKQVKSPVITPHGYLYCKECILENILAQKKNIKQNKEELELEKKKENLQKLLEEKEKEEKIKKEFDKITNYKSEDLVFGTKEKKQSLSSGDNFWIPTKTPEASDASLKKIKEEILDPCCSKPIKLKLLLDVNFKTSKEEEKKFEQKFECPCCRKNFEGGLKCIVLKPCGDTICVNCFKKFTSKDLVCLVCSKKLKTSKDFIQIEASFTSFSSSAGEKSVSKHWEPQIMYS
jgi:nitric oxide synthase-interacting protein